MVVERIEAWRQRRFTGEQFAAELGVLPATASRVLRRLGLDRLEAPELPQRSAATSAGIRAS